MSERHPLTIVKEDPGAEVSRRGFLELLGAGVFLGGLAACEPPRGEIIPYTRQPREVIPGKPRIYATSMIERGYAFGILATSSSGRPTKVDGNPDHPANPGGGSWTSQQASILDLYEPARARVFRKGEQTTSWSRFLEEARGPLRERLHFLMGPTSSPLLITRIEAIRSHFPDAVFHFYDPLHSAAEQEGIRRGFGAQLLRRYRFERAQTIAAFDSDFLAESAWRVRYAHDFATNRRVRRPEDGMSRLYVAEGELSLVGALADHRYRCRPSEIPSLLAHLVAEIGRQQGASGGGGQRWSQLLGAAAQLRDPPPWIRALASDLVSKRGRGLVTVGERQSPEAQLLGDAINDLLGNMGETVVFTEPVLFEAEKLEAGLTPLAQALERGEVGSLFIFDVDPVYDAPADLPFAELLGRAKSTVYAGLWENQTARACQWKIPGVHYLERWGDGRAYDGTLSLTQPLIRPLYAGRSITEILAGLSGDLNPDDHRLLRDSHSSLSRSDWQGALQRGFIEGALPPSEVQLSVAAATEAFNRARAPVEGGGLELSLRQDPKLGGGEGGGNDWLIELPDPITRLSWGNAALLSPATAKRLEVEEGQLVEIQRGERSIEIPVLPVEGMADELIGLRLGWGNPAHERDVERGFYSSSQHPVGVNVYPLRTSDAPWIQPGASIRPVVARGLPVVPAKPRFERLALAQSTMETHGRPIVLEESLEGFRANPDFVYPHDELTPDLYGSPWTYTSGDQWGMSVDLNTCIGCNACMVACQAENNIPTVGKIDAFKGRTMYWIRVDRYRLGETDDDPRLIPQPMMCQHCERAPCEYVCPVNATVHSPDGLNEMVYNRCIGTRFCSNNCPYKVRRFNYFRYNAADMPETLQMLKNPDVTVRGRGVIEKCTYCVQRIRTAQIEARVHGRQLVDGEVRTACQDACPTQAITFGLISDPQSPVSQAHALSRSYKVLNAELGTEPRTRYLAHIRNPNPELDGDV